MNLDDFKPATDRLLDSLAQGISDRRAHEHTTRGEDFYCLNLVAFAGERIGPVLRRLRDAEAALTRVRALTVSTDGDAIDSESEIPVGELVRALDDLVGPPATTDEAKCASKFISQDRPCDSPPDMQVTYRSSKDYDRILSVSGPLCRTHAQHESNCAFASGLIAAHSIDPWNGQTAGVR